jgi:hypothetical protein
MRRKIVIMLINLGLGLFTVSMFLISARETYISETRDNITCDIIKLDLEYSSRQHPTATLIYQNKEYITYINSVDSLQIGLNNTTFFYDELFDRVFCRNSGIAKGQYVALVFFILSFLLWLEPNSNINNKKKRHNR